MSKDNQSKNMMKYGIIGIVAVIAVVGIVSAVSFSTPDFDKIIEEKDCEAFGKLIESDFEKANVSQQLKLGMMSVGCLFDGM